MNEELMDCPIPINKIQSLFESIFLLNHLFFRLTYHEVRKETEVKSPV